MGMSLFGLLGRRRTPARAASRRSTPPTRYFRPALEGLEDRTVMSVAAVAPLLGEPPALIGAAHAGAAELPSPVAPALAGALNITGFRVHGHRVEAVGTLFGLRFTTPVNVTLDPPTASAAQPAQVTSPILHLELGPIDLNLLGLRVQLTKTCLEISADQATPPGPLADLLGSLTRLPTGGRLARLLNSAQLLSVVNTAVDNLLAPSPGSAPGPAQVPDDCMDTLENPTPSCNILHAVVGPVKLNVLGLNVTLSGANATTGECDEDCPIVLDVTAIHTISTGGTGAGAHGGFLGDLLCAILGG